MRRDQFSSNSDSQDQNIDGHYKLVKYSGQISYSEHLDSYMEESNSNYEKIGQKQGQKLKNCSSSILQKSKTIKKNCQSAKASRQRKKIYLQILQHTAMQLKDQINTRKTKIQSVFDEIIIKFRTMNKEKQKYLIQKILMSKKILQMNQELQLLKKSSIKKEQLKIQAQKNEIQKNITPQTLSIPRVNSFSAEQMTKTKLKKKKASQVNLNANVSIGLQDKIQEKESILDLGINAFLYQFGSQGFYRSQVRQRSKYQWIQSLSNLTFNQSQELKQAIQVMKNKLQNLQKKIKKIDFYIRQLQNHIKQKSVVQFLLDKQFFAFKMKNQKLINHQIREQ